VSNQGFLGLLVHNQAAVGVGKVPCLVILGIPYEVCQSENLDFDFSKASQFGIVRSTIFYT
jgi:hypothetical protein